MKSFNKWITVCFIFAGIFSVERLVTQTTSDDFSHFDSISAPSKGTNQRLFLLLVDGMPYRTATDSLLMPNLVKLQKQSAFAKVNTTFEAYSSSAIRAAFSGTIQNSIFDVINNFKHDKSLHINSIFTDLLKDSIEVHIYSDGHFNQFGDVFTDKYRRFENEYYTETDKRIPEEAFNEFQNSSTPFVIAHYETTDWIGHQFGTESIQYKNTYLHIDSLIGEFSQNLKQNEHLIIVGDHGMNKLGEHKTGMNIPTYLSLTGSLVHKNTELGTLNITQVKDIIAIIFNTPINPYHSPISNLLSAFTINPELLNIRFKPLPSENHTSWLQLSLLVLFLMGYAFYRLSELTHKLNVIPILLLISGLLSTSLFLQIGLLLTSFIAFVFIKQNKFQIDYSILIVGILTTCVTYFSQKMGFIKTSASAFFFIFSFISLIFQKKLILNQKNIYLLIACSLSLLFLSFPYRISTRPFSEFIPFGISEIILIYTIGILSKLFIFFKDVRSIKSALIPLVGIIICLLPEIQAVSITHLSDKVYFITSISICISGLILSIKNPHNTLLRKYSSLTLLFVLLYHSYQIPIYHYFFFDIGLASLLLILNSLKPNQNRITTTILLSAILLGASTLINSTTNGIEWKFLYTWFEAVHVEKNMWFYFPIILVKFSFPVLIIKQIFKPFLNTEIIVNTFKIGSNLFILILIAYILDYGILSDKVFFNTNIELFLTSTIMFFTLFYRDNITNKA